MIPRVNQQKAKSTPSRDVPDIMPITFKEVQVFIRDLLIWEICNNRKDKQNCIINIGMDILRRMILMSYLSIWQLRQQIILQSLFTLNNIKLFAQYKTMLPQHHTNSLSQLHQFLTQISTQPDPYWQTILQSDIRNIIPKHQVCKIQLVKNSLSKTRLIMQNLNTFISLEVKKKHLKQEMIDLNQNVVCELQEVMGSKEQPGGQTIHYDMGLNKRKRQLEVIAKELSRSKTSSELKLLIEKNKKWQQYIDKHVKELEKAQQGDMHEDIVNFIQTYQELFIVQSNPQVNDINLPSKQIRSEILLKSGNYAKLYENELEERVLISKLLDDVYGVDEQNAQPNDQDDYWGQEVVKIRKLNDI